MKQQRQRADQHEHGERPAAEATCQAEAPAKRGAFEKNRGSLQEEESGWAAPTAACRQRDDQLVHDPAEEKTNNEGGLRGEARRQGAEQEEIRQVAESEDAALAPELAYTDRQDGPIQDRSRTGAEGRPHQ